MHNNSRKTTPKATPPKPKRRDVDLDKIPEELKRLNQWVVWRYEFEDGRLAKVLLDPEETRKPKRAKTNDPSTWSSFEVAVETYRKKRKEWELAGIGFVLTEDDEFVGIDQDNCIDTETGEIEEWAQHIIRRVGSYAEVSPSERGVKIIAKGPRLERGRTREMGEGGRKLEIYSHGRYFTITGWHLEDTPAEIRDATDMQG